MQMESDWSTHTNKRPRQTQHVVDETPSVETNNRFSPLATTEESIHKPPPVYVKNVPLKDYKHLLNQLKAIAGTNFECQATQNNGVTIYPRTSDAYREIIKFLKDSSVSYHTYQLPHEKAFRVVIRHLHPSTDVEEISQALSILSFEVRNVVNVLQSGTRIPLPLFFVDLEPKPNNNKIFELKSLLFTRISVEEPRKKRISCSVGDVCSLDTANHTAIIL
jgi:hypothetical protein